MATTLSPWVGVSPVAMAAGSVSVTQQPPEDGPRTLKVIRNTKIPIINTRIVIINTRMGITRI